MSEKNDNKNECIQKKSEGHKSKNSKAYNRRNVNTIKKFLVFTFLVVCAMPILFCLYLMVRMNAMEQKLNDMCAKLNANNETAITEGDNELSLEELDKQAYDELEINTTSPNHFLTNSGGASTATASDAQSAEAQSTEAAAGSTIEDIADEAEEDFIANGKTVYLTFDDGPSVNTGTILDILAKNNVKATFFLCYNEDESVWPMYKRIADEGHTIALHSYSHVYKTVYADEEAFINDVTMIHDFVYEQTGVDSRIYRFPGGSSNTVSNVDIQTLMAYLYEEGYTYFDWNALNGDAVNSSVTPEELNENVMGYVRSNPGDSVVLMHDLGNVTATADALQDLIDTLKAEGYTLAAIDENTAPVQHVTFKGIDE